MPFAVRMTGGYAMYHNRDLSYSIFLSKSYNKELQSVKKSYEYLSKFILNLYKSLGLYSYFAGKGRDGKIPSNICHASNEIYDILVEDRKIGGNAQRHSKTLTFQHGSIPIKQDLNDIKDVFKGGECLGNSVCLDDLNIKVSFTKLRQRLISIFKETYHIEFINSFLSKEEELLKNEILKEELCKI